MIRINYLMSHVISKMTISISPSNRHYTFICCNQGPWLDFLVPRPPERRCPCPDLVQANAMKIPGRASQNSSLWFYDSCGQCSVHRFPRHLDICSLLSTEVSTPIVAASWLRRFGYITSLGVLMVCQAITHPSNPAEYTCGRPCQV